MGNVRRQPPLRTRPELTLDGSTRHWNRPPALRDLLHVQPTFPTTSLEFKSTGLNGTITGYKEVSQASAPRTAFNSTSLERQPSSYVGSFVRGKSSYFPFRPGGLTDVVLDLEEEVGLEEMAEGMEKAFEKGRGAFKRGPWIARGDGELTSRCGDRPGGIRTIPPGFTRGLDFGPLADNAEGQLMEEEEAVEVTPIYRPMLELTSDGGTSAVLVSSDLTPRPSRILNGLLFRMADHNLQDPHRN